MKKEEKKNIWNFLIAIGIVAVVALIGGIGAKYLIKFSSDKGKMTADKFYFTTNLIGDQTMIPSEGENSEEYQYEDIQKGEWHLYGGEAHEISFQVRNYADTKRVTEDEISYSASVISKKADGTEIKNLATIKKNDETVQNTQDTTVTSVLPGKSPTRDLLVLAIQDSKTNSYDEGTEVVVTIASISPYKKTMEFHFKLYTVETYLSYEVKDSVDSPYAELFIMTNIVDGSSNGNGGVQPTLVWPQELSIDNTNSLTYTDGFTQAEGIENRKMKISQELKAGESESIYFFKSNPKKNYSKKRTIVEPGQNSEYTIDLLK